MDKNGLINKISSQGKVSSIRDMQVLDEQSKAYFNFINSLKSESTRRSYTNQYKNLIIATLKHACEINDVVLNWKKIKKFINSDKTGNETNGRDRGYIDKKKLLSRFYLT